MGSGADNVSRRPRLESRIVGQEGAIIASRVFNECEPHNTYTSEWKLHEEHIAINAEQGATDGEHETQQEDWS